MEDESGGDGDENQYGPNLDEHDYAVDGGPFLNTDYQDRRHQRNHQKRHYIEDRRGVRKCRRVYARRQRSDRLPKVPIIGQLSSRRGDPLWREIDAEPSEQLHDISGPAGGYRRGAEGIFENQVPADDPGNEFAQGRVAIGISRARDRNQRGEFGVTQAR